MEHACFLSNVLFSNLKVKKTSFSFHTACEQPQPLPGVKVNLWYKRRYLWKMSFSFDTVKQTLNRSLTLVCTKLQLNWGKCEVPIGGDMGKYMGVWALKFVASVVGVVAHLKQTHHAPYAFDPLMISPASHVLLSPSLTVTPSLNHMLLSPILLPYL